LPVTIAYVGLGSNLDAPAAQIERALAALARLPATTLIARSRFYSSPPWGLRDQPDFVNAVAQLDTELPATGLMQHLLGIERAAGRDRNCRIHACTSVRSSCCRSRNLPRRWKSRVAARYRA